MANAVQPLIQNLMKAARPRLDTFVKYARVELTPPSPADIPEIARGIGNLMSGFRARRWKQLTVREAWLNTLVGAEVAFWFFIGECIGKRHIVGYKV